jgi:hypothetical protein
LHCFTKIHPFSSFTNVCLGFRRKSNILLFLWVSTWDLENELKVYWIHKNFGFIVAILEIHFTRMHSDDCKPQHFYLDWFFTGLISLTVSGSISCLWEIAQ